MPIFYKPHILCARNLKHHWRRLLVSKPLFGSIKFHLVHLLYSIVYICSIVAHACVSCHADRFDYCIYIYICWNIVVVIVRYSHISYSSCRTIKVSTTPTYVLNVSSPTNLGRSEIELNDTLSYTGAQLISLLLKCPVSCPLS